MVGKTLWSLQKCCAFISYTFHLKSFEGELAWMGSKILNHFIKKILSKETTEILSVVSWSYVTNIMCGHKDLDLFIHIHFVFLQKGKYNHVLPSSVYLQLLWAEISFISTVYSHPTHPITQRCIQLVINPYGHCSLHSQELFS